MIEHLALAVALGLAWLLVPLPFAIFIGRCISVGQAGETARHAAVAVEPDTTPALPASDAVSATDHCASTASELPALPPQRQPQIPARRVG